jgi:capsular exopolysaccharide synthesis family protein
MAKSKRKSANESSNASRQLIQNLNIDPSLKFRVEEAYKSIRANIMFSVMKKGCKTIVVSSASPNEGKTTTTINLAITFSQADQKVLLIDGDLRKPKIHHYFSLPNAPGLTNYLGSTVSTSRKDRVDLYDVIHPTEFENLSILCSGSIPPNPAELLGSELMANFLDEISKDFDYIIIDTPPINVVSDALPVIREADGVVLVVRSNHTTHPDIQRAISSLEFIDAKILGFVVNFVGNPTGGKYGYGKYGGYRYGSRYSRYSSYGTYGSYGGYGGYGYGYGYNGYSSYPSDNKNPIGAMGVNLNRTPTQSYYQDQRNND